MFGLDGFDKYLKKNRGTLDGLAAGMAQGFSSGNPTFDAAVGGGLAFLQSEFEKPDLKVREPLKNVTWMRDMPTKVGGGWIDYTSNFFSDYQISGPDLFGIQANNNTQIPLVQTNITKDEFPVFNWQNQMQIKFIDMKKLERTPRSLQDLLDTGIRLNWNLALNNMTYFGLAKIGLPVYGLVNDPAVVQSVASGTLASMTPQQISNTLNGLIMSVITSSQYDDDAIPNQLNLPWNQYSYLADTIITVAGYPAGVSILKWLLENNIAKQRGVDFKIEPCRQCAGAGVGATDRAVCYVNDEDKIVMDIPVPASRVMTQATIESSGGAFNTLFAGQIGVVKKLYTQTIAYLDGI